MTQQIQAYFRTEDEAEGARTSLLAYRAENLEVGKLESALGRDTRVLIPLVPYNTAGSMNTGGVAGVAGAPGGANHIVPTVEDADKSLSQENLNEDRGVDSTQSDSILDTTDVYTNGDYYDKLHYVLSAKVADADYDEIVNKLRSNYAYIAQLD